MGFHDKIAADSSTAIDLEHLGRYTLGNQSLQEEVLALFRSQSEVYLQRLQDASDEKAWADAAHTLKGSARSVGATDVARRAEAAEQLTGEPRSEAHQTARRELATLVAQANRCIADILGDLGDQTPVE